MYIRILGKMSFGGEKQKSPLLKENNSLKAAVLDDFLLNVAVSLFPPTAEMWLSLAPPSLHSCLEEDTLSALD